MLNRKQLERIQSLAIAVSVLGALFKIMHWPGANIMLIIGLSSVSMCHIGLALAEQSHGAATWRSYLKHYAIALLVMGYLFRAMHWPGAKEMLIPGVFALVVSLVFSLLSNETHEEENNNP